MIARILCSIGRGAIFEECRIFINLYAAFYYNLLLFITMKKFLIIASALLISTGAYAQHEVGSLTFQPKVGLNIASVIGSEDDVDARIGLAAGVEFEYQMTDLVSLAAGALYSMQGAEGGDWGVNMKIQLDYINIPILVNVYVLEGLAVKLGVQPGFNVRDHYKVSAFGVSGSGSLSDSGLDLNKFDFSIPVGLSYEFSNFVIDARYFFAVTKMIDNFDSKNSVFQFTLGYKFDLK